MIARRVLAAALLLAAGCGEGRHPVSGTVALALTTAFIPGELATVDIYVIDGTLAQCIDNREVDGDAQAIVTSQVGIRLSTDPVEFTLEPGAYVVHVAAGRAPDRLPPAQPVASGCAAVTLEAGQEATLSVPIFRHQYCGDGILDLHEQCDDSNLEAGDGCDGSCVLEQIRVNAFTDADQYRPLAVGGENLLAVTWITNGTPDMAPMRLFDRNAQPRSFRGTTEESFLPEGNTRDPTALASGFGWMLMAYMNGWRPEPGSPDGRWPYAVGWSSALEEGERTVIGESGDLVGAIAIVSTDSAFVVRSGLAGEVRQLFMVPVATGDGEPWALSTDTPIPVGSEGSEEQTDPDLAVGEEGFLVAWISDRTEIHARAFDLSGEAVEDEIVLSAGGHDSAAPAVAYREDSPSFLVVWPDLTYNRIVGRFVDGGEQVGDVFDISIAESSITPDAVGLSSELVVVWNQAPSGDPADRGDIYARVVADEGEFGYFAQGNALTNEPFPVAQQADGTQFDPSVTAATGSDTTTVFVVWTDGGGDVGQDIGGRLLRVARPPDPAD